MSKFTIRRFYREGFSNSELAIMYGKSVHKIAGITRGIKREERGND